MSSSTRMHVFRKRLWTAAAALAAADLLNINAYGSQNADWPWSEMDGATTNGL
jgi:hypothetical protein